MRSRGAEIIFLDPGITLLHCFFNLKKESEVNLITCIVSETKQGCKKKEDFCLAEVNLEEDEGARDKRIELMFSFSLTDKVVVNKIV